MRKIFGAAVVALLTVVGAPAAHSTTGASRIFGNDRFLTAIAISQSTYKNNGSASSVVLSRSDDFADALAGTPLAVAKNGPTLLTPTDTLDSPTEAEIKRVLPSGATVYVLGGASAISDAVATQILNDGYTVTRLAGGDRFATAVKIAQTVGTPKTILLARGDDPGDALAAGAAAAKIGGVVVLTDGPNMPSATSDYLSANSQVPVVAVGADAATADPSAASVVGTDRFDTSVLVAQKFFSAPTAIAFANGFAFPDALSGGPAVGKLSGPLMLVDYAHLPQSVHDYVVSVHTTLNIAEIYGGPGVISGGTGQTNGGEESAIDGALAGQ